MFLSKPGWADLNSANLTPASGRQDHTILPSAKSVSRQRAGDRSRVFRPAMRSHRAPNAAASTASHPNVRDDHDTPLLRGGMAESINLFLPGCEAKYFCWRYWTGFSSARPSGKSVGCCAVAGTAKAEGLTCIPCHDRRFAIEARRSHSVLAAGIEPCNVTNDGRLLPRSQQGRRGIRTTTRRQPPDADPA